MSQRWRWWWRLPRTVLLLPLMLPIVAAIMVITIVIIVLLLLPPISSYRPGLRAAAAVDITVSRPSIAAAARTVHRPSNRQRRWRRCMPLLLLPLLVWASMIA